MRPIAFGLGLGILLCTLVAGGFLLGWELRGDLVALRQRAVLTPSTAVVVAKVQSLGRLETTRYTLQQVLEARSVPVLAIGGASLPLSPFQDCIVLVAQGEVIAGIDLRRISVDDVQIAGTSVTLRLPPAEILVTRLENQATRVAYRCHPPLNLGRNDGLEGEARTAAEEGLRRAALADGLLERAASSARETLVPLLRALGFQQVYIVP